MIIMEEVFKFISEKPEYTVWFIGIINISWIVFIYFNRKKHDRKLIELKQSFDLDLERRKTVYEMKATQYESYFKHIDSIHKKHQTDYQDVLRPIINEFMSTYLRASDNNDKTEETNATIRFSKEISKITYDGFQELRVMESETNSLRLTASDNVALLLDDIQMLYEQLFTISCKVMSDLVEIIINDNQELAARNQVELMKIGELAKSKAKELRQQMRNDLKTI